MAVDEVQQGAITWRAALVTSAGRARRRIGGVLWAGLTVVAVVLAGVVGLGPSSASAITAPGGWTNPVPGNPAAAAGFLSNECGFPGYGGYTSGYYHFGQDLMSPAGSAVLAIGGGEVVQNFANWDGLGNRGVGIRHTASDGTVFVALYGHIQSTIPVHSIVVAGQQIGTVGSHPSGDHLHFGISPGGINPNNQGRLPCSSWPSTNGFVDPFPYLSAHPAQGGGGGGGGGGAAALTNGGFESANTGWGVTYNPGGVVNRSVWTTPGRARTGSGFLEANTSVTDGSVGQDTTNVPQPGQFYSLRVWVRDPSGGGDPFEVAIALWALGGTQERALTQAKVGSAWMPVDVVLPVVYGGHSRIRVEFYMTTVNRNINFDDVTLSVSTTDPGINTSNPLGSFDSVTSPAPGKITVKGWSFDPNWPTAANQVHIYIGGQSGQAGAVRHDLGNATVSRPDLIPSYPWAGANHGFEATLPTSATGPTTVCAYGINLTAGHNPLLGGACKTVTVLSGNTLSVSKTGSGGGDVSSSPGSISCGSTCSGAFSPESVVTLTATPSIGSVFAGWSGACSGLGPCSVSMSSPRSVTATFVLPGPGLQVFDSPKRLVDTRPGQRGVLEASADEATAFAAGETRRYLPSPITRVPGGASMMLTAAVVSPAAGGFLVAWPCDSASSSPPAVSMLNYQAGVTVSNNGLVKLDTAAGGLCVKSSAAANVILDAFGWFATPSTYSALGQPQRLVDTRAGQIGVLETFGDESTPFTGTTVRRYVVAGLAGVPSGSVAAAVNVAAVGPSGSGQIRLYPCASTASAASTSPLVVFTPGSTISGGGTVTLSPDGGFCVRATAGTHVIVDVTGWYTAGNYRTFAAPGLPKLLVDTRAGTKGGLEAVDANAPLVANTTYRWALAGKAGFPLGSQIASVRTTITELSAAANGYLSVWACASVATPPPATALLNYRAMVPIAGSVIVPVAGVDAGICVRSSQTTHIAINSTNWFAP